MIVTDDLANVELDSSIVCLGTFDGVHLGHRMLLERMQELSNKQKQASVVISFQPPAKVFLQGDHFLSSYEEKLKLLKAFKPDAVAMIPFSFEYAKTDKSIFLRQIAALNPSHIIVGEDFRFGHKRLGNLVDLSQIAAKLEIFGMRTLKGINVKSSYIRMLLKEANLQEAKSFLGYEYFAIGKVIQGEKRGKSIGFPTANISLSKQKLLPYGVFVVEAETSKGVFWGMANVGPRPSFPEEPPALEVHLFDFASEIYHEDITVYFKHFLRTQIKFLSLAELKKQLAEDARQAKTYCQGSRGIPSNKDTI